MNRVGIRTSDWYSVGGGDGFQPRVDPEDPTTVYVQSQEGALSRLDLTTGRSIAIRPRPQNTTRRRQAAGSGAAVAGRAGRRARRRSRPGTLRPLALGFAAHHQPALSRRLYYGGERLYRSDDRGDSWDDRQP